MADVFARRSLLEDFDIYVVMLDSQDPNTGTLADSGDEDHPIDLSGEKDSPNPLLKESKQVRTYAIPLRSSKRHRGPKGAARKRGSIRVDKSDTILTAKQKARLASLGRWDTTNRLEVL